MAENSVQISLGRAKVNEDLRILASDTQELLRLTASATGEQLDGLRTRLTGRLGALKSKAVEAKGVTHANASALAGTADEYVRQKPWQALGLGVAAGIVLGALLAR
ncbi:MAG: DUF883 family protein [Janthinobacterium lividum]